VPDAAEMGGGEVPGPPVGRPGLLADLLTERSQDCCACRPGIAVNELSAASALEPGDLIVEGGLPEAGCLGGHEDAGVAGDDQQPVQASPGAGPMRALRAAATTPPRGLPARWTRSATPTCTRHSPTSPRRTIKNTSTTVSTSLSTASGPTPPDRAACSRLPQPLTDG
jgi:hypothetical protein